MSFDAGAWLARQISCRPEELVLVEARTSDSTGREEGRYRRAGTDAGRVIVSGVIRLGLGESFRQVTGFWAPGGTSSATIGPWETVVW